MTIDNLKARAAEMLKFRIMANDKERISAELRKALILIDEMKNHLKGETKYLIWSNEHNSWWLPHHGGYTQSVQAAGRYSLMEAWKICNGANYSWNTDNVKNLPDELLIDEDAAKGLIYGQHNKRYPLE